MQRLKWNQLNIKTELLLSFCSYFIISYIYIGTTLTIKSWLVCQQIQLTGIILRNTITFLSTTLMTLNLARKQLDDADYHNDERLNMKQKALTLEITLTH